MRDGLWLLLGCFCPERLKALESIRISYIDLEHGRIEFPADKVKTKEENERVMPETVRAVISVWIDNYRALYASEHDRSEEHTSELQSLMRNSYAIFCLSKKKGQH